MKNKQRDEDKIIAALDTLAESISHLSDLSTRYDAHIDSAVKRNDDDSVKQLIKQKMGVNIMIEQLSRLKESIILGACTSKTISEIRKLPGSISDCTTSLSNTANLGKVANDIARIMQDVQKPSDSISALASSEVKTKSGDDEATDGFIAEYEAALVRAKANTYNSQAPDTSTETQGWCAEIFDANKSAVVRITALAKPRKINGTGFIISDKGYLLTNAHIVFDKQNDCYYPKISMSFVGEQKSYDLKVLFSDREADVALCRFDPNETASFTCVKRISDYSKLKQGADCVAIGNGFGMGLAPISGTVRFTKSREGNLVYTVPSNPGDSGAPVFNRNGECIGINKSRIVTVNGEEADGFANATPMDTIEKLLREWVDKNNFAI